MKLFFKELFEYSYHFNQKLVEVFNENPDKISDKASRLFNHILNAHQIWNNRIEPKQSTFGVWELHPVNDLKKIDQNNFEQSLEILDKFDLKEIITYSNSNGQVFRKSIQDKLFHIINHSTYHRGQIATEFKQCGLEPLATDYIRYK